MNGLSVPYVFMGMGEPLDNYDTLSRALEVLTADWGFGWSPKRITVSTIGVMPALKRFLDEQRCHLAVSLHNPFPEEREQMMPVQKAFDEKDSFAEFFTSDTAEHGLAFLRDFDGYMEALGRLFDKAGLPHDKVEVEEFVPETPMEELTRPELHTGTIFTVK